MTTQSESGKLLTRVWMNALEETARDFHGTRPKEFCMRAYEHATDSWIKIIEDEHGIQTPKADTMMQAIRNHIQAGMTVGVFEREDLFELEELPDGSVKVKVNECIYQASCRDLLDTKRFSLKSLNCARVGCFRAAASLLTAIDCTYDVVDVQPGIGCEGIIRQL